MFKMPEKQRIQEIADMVPEWISIFSSRGGGYSATIAKMGAALQLSKIAKELGINMSYSSSFGMNDVIDIMAKYDVPDMLILKTSIGRLRVFFDDSSNNSIFDLGDSFTTEYMDGCLYALSSKEVPPEVLNMLKGLGLKSYKNLITGTAENLT